MRLPPGVLHSLRSQLSWPLRHDLVRVLSALLERATEVLGDRLVGVYLTGSFGLGRGDEASDVDFLVVSEGDLTAEQEAGARLLHRLLWQRDELWARRLEGSWISDKALRDPVGSHGPWLYLDNGSSSMQYSDHDDTWNARWVLRHAGAALFGPQATGLLPEVPATAISTEAVTKADEVEAWIKAEPDILLHGWGQPYVVLTACRLLWAANHGTVISKAEAAEWAVRFSVPSRYRELITASVSYRTRPFDPQANKADPALAPLVVEFVEWATPAIHEQAATSGL